MYENLELLDPISEVTSAIEMRNKAWENNKHIPSWVDIESIDLDQFFTRPDVAKKCWKAFCDYIIADGGDITKYKFVEPSAGLGSFYDLLPKNKRVGIDLVQFRPEYLKGDFLSWTPHQNGTKYVCVGNPPFGYRAWLALIFLNHAALFSDYVGFILPMGFQSRGKSNLIDRVKGLHLVHTSRLPNDSFVKADGKSAKINAIWQIWARKKNGKNKKVPTCNQYIDLFTVDQRKERLCGHMRMHEADFFLQRTFYNSPPTLVKTFDQVKYVCGYGIVIKRDKRKITKLLRNTDWRKYNNLASHNCKHISMCHIRQALTDAGFVDA
ncbi:MAG: hypothetical protein KAR17_09820 [Cyclobacteriaceae bacterium]|nr:hypothetical protein [Cyclobacteriaceae bacterium]